MQPYFMRRGFICMTILIMNWIYMRETKRYIIYLAVSETCDNATGKRLGVLAYVRSHCGRQSQADVYRLHDLSQNKHAMCQEKKNKSSVTHKIPQDSRCHTNALSRRSNSPDAWTKSFQVRRLALTNHEMGYRTSKAWHVNMTSVTQQIRQKRMRILKAVLKQHDREYLNNKQADS